MPPWIIHDKWALGLGINQEISKEVNLLIDFPEKWFEEKYSDEDFEAHRFSELIDHQDPCISFFGLSKGFGKFGHDMGRRRKWQRDLQLECVYKHYGIQGVKATILHHILDYAERIYWLGEEEILKRVYKRFENVLLYPNRLNSIELNAISRAVSEVLEFVKCNIEDIIDDLRRHYGGSIH